MFKITNEIYTTDSHSRSNHRYGNIAKYTQIVLGGKYD